jgi:multiple sugar transport system substrate-binding protein
MRMQKPECRPVRMSREEVMRDRHVALASAVAAVLAGPTLAETVRIAGFGGSDPVVINGLLTEVLADDLKAADIQVEYTPVEGDFSQYLTNALSAGTAPDLFYVDIFWSDAIFGGGQAAPVADASVGEALLPNLVEAFTRDGQLMGIPKDFNTLAVHYNLDVFEDAGVEPPDADDTWDDFAQKLRTVQEELGDVAGICVVPDYARFGPFALATGWRPFDEEGRTVLDENFRRAFEWYTGLVTNGGGVVAADQGEGWTGGCLVNEKAAVAVEGAWIIGAVRDNAPSMVWGTAPIPSDPVTGERGNLLFTVAWVVNANSPVQDKAQQLAQLLTSEEAQQWVLEQGLALPSRAALADNPFLQEDSNAAMASRIVFEGAEGGAVMPYYFGEYGGAWMEPINSAINAVILEQADVDTALAEAQERLDQLMAQ